MNTTVASKNGLAGFSQATRDMANEWLNNSDLANEYASCSDRRAEAMLVGACTEIVNSECDEAARIARL